jgi:hypothetical protein
MAPLVGSAKPFFGVRTDTHTRSLAVRPEVALSYEQMFPSRQTSTLAQRTLGALRLTRSFLLLEDDYDVDWEVDENEPGRTVHPHRAPLRGRYGQRRPGQPASLPHACLCPIHSTAPSVRVPTKTGRPQAARV